MIEQSIGNLPQAEKGYRRPVSIYLVHLSSTVKSAKAPKQAKFVISGGTISSSSIVWCRPGWHQRWHQDLGLCASRTESLVVSPPCRNAHRVVLHVRVLADDDLLIVPRGTPPYHTLESAPILTLPTTIVAGATNTLSAICGPSSAPKTALA
jgi:hypothetical protein